MHEKNFIEDGRAFYDLSLGRRDSPRPATSAQLGVLPSPFSNVDSLLGTFASRGPADLVALSGGHTVGKASCALIRAGEDFTRTLARQCSASPARKQSLDVITQGVLASDQGLFDHPRTSPIVSTFANNQPAFFTQFATSMIKMSNIVGGGAAGEIRRNCFRPNNARLQDDHPDDEQGLAAAT